MDVLGIDFEDLVSGSNCKLVLCGILGSNFVVLHCSLFQLSSWASSHFPPVLAWLLGEFLLLMQGLLLVFSMGMCRPCGVLWLTLCSTLNGITLSSNWNVLKCNSYNMLLF